MSPPPFYEVLPVELVIQIVQWLISDDKKRCNYLKLLTEELRSRKLRQILTSALQLWNVVTARRGSETLAFANLCLQRSKRIPIQLELDVFDMRTVLLDDFFMTFLAGPASRIKQLSITGPYDKAYDIQDRLSKIEFPVLTTFVFQDSTINTSHNSSRSRACPIPAGAPSLQTLHLSRTLLPWKKGISIRTVTSLVISYSLVMETYMPGCNSFYEAERMADTLAQLSAHLENLTFKGYGMESYFTYGEQEWKNVVEFPKLKTLEVLSADQDFVIHLFSRIQAPLLEEVIITDPVLPGQQFRRGPASFVIEDNSQFPSVSKLRFLEKYLNHPANGAFYDHLPQWFPNIVSLELAVQTSRVLIHTETCGWPKLQHLKLTECVRKAPMPQRAQPDSVSKASDDPLEATYGRAAKRLLDFIGRRKKAEGSIPLRSLGDCIILPEVRDYIKKWYRSKK